MSPTSGAAETAAVSDCPECRDGKHQNCDGRAWDTVTDEPADCPCEGRRHQVAAAAPAGAVRVVRLPLKHAQDWLGRCGEDFGAVEVAQTARTITLRLPKEALADLISDTDHYVSEMGPDSTGDVDYRPAARRCWAALEKQGLLPA